MFWLRNKKNSFPLCGFIWLPGITKGEKMALQKFMCLIFIKEHYLEHTYDAEIIHTLLNMTLHGNREIYLLIESTVLKAHLSRKVMGKIKVYQLVCCLICHHFSPLDQLNQILYWAFLGWGIGFGQLTNLRWPPLPYIVKAIKNFLSRT